MATVGIWDEGPTRLPQDCTRAWGFAGNVVMGTMKYTGQSPGEAFVLF
jgi:hypothetical protein